MEEYRAKTAPILPGYEARGIVQRVDGMVSQYLALQASGKSGKQRRNLTTLINSSTAARGLSVSRLQPNSRGEIQVRLENASFDDLMAWLHRMEFGECQPVEIDLDDRLRAIDPRVRSEGCSEYD